MVQPVSSVPPALPAPQVSAAPSPPTLPAQHPAPGGQATVAGSDIPLSAAVKRADNGVFVYTLKDTDSGRVVVVVPHVELRSDGVRT